jgi:hypothetical protein
VINSVGEISYDLRNGSRAGIVEEEFQTSLLCD